ncbi:MAG: hypothetical protein K2J93_06990 [Anaeroplasmataceae bacterium]|nr:hypothetical protein [Anaeroplasmataceae bacterium]
MFRKKDYIDQEISVFKPNVIDFFWLMLFIILNTVLTIRSTSLMEYTIRIFIYDLFNIILTLVMFLAAEQVKKYHKQWSYVVIGVGVFQLLHIAFLPEHTNTIFNIVLYVITGVLAIYAGISSLIKSIFRANYIKKEGV